MSITHTPLAHLLHAVKSTESTPPVYYASAWVWARIFGSGEVGLRALSAVLGTATIPLLFAAGRQAVSARAGLIAAALAAVSPLLVWYSQEARAYALLVFLGVLGLVCFLRALERPTGRRLALWGAVSALALGTHYFAAFTIAAEGLWLLVRLPAARRLVVGCIALPLGAAAALAPLLVYQRDHVPRPWTGMYSVANQTAATYQEFLVGHTWTWLIHRPGVVVLSGFFLVSVVALWRRGDLRERGGGVLFAALGAATFVVPAGVSLAGSNYLAPRNVLVALPLGLLVAGAGLGARRVGLVGTLVAADICVVCVAIVVAVDTTQRLQRDDWRGVAATTRIHSGARLVVAGDRFNSTPVTRLYFGAGVAPRAVSEVLAIARGHDPSRLPVPPPGFSPGIVVQRGGLEYVRYAAARPAVVSAPADAAVVYQPPAAR